MSTKRPPHLLRPACGLVALLLAGAGVAFVGDVGRRVARHDASATPPPAPAPLPELAGAALAHWQQFALNGLLGPLVSDDGPLTWAEGDADTPCAATSRIEVDGRPIVAGAPLPAVPFSISWRLEDCRPFGAPSLGLTGVVDMRVVPLADRIDADVFPSGLVVAAEGRLARTDRPFAATLRLAPAP